MTPQVISIDLGSTYTKVAIRKEGGGSRPAHIMEFDHEVLIPTMVVMSQRGVTQRWFTGIKAANLRTEAGDRVYVNWKAPLFAHPSVRAGVRSFGEAPVRFFRWLKKGLDDQGVDVNGSKVRVSVPAFETDHKAHVVRALVGCMEEAGWKKATLETVEEPLANLLGVVTGGQNHSHGRQIHYGSMLPSDSPFIHAARKSALYNIDKRLIIAIVDIGSYTTDVSHVCFMPDEPDGYFAVMGEESHEFGVIEKLEKPLFEAFPAAMANKVRKLSFRERELAKVSLLSKEAQEFHFELEGGHYKIGDPAHRRLTSEHIGRFADGIARVIGPSFSASRPSHICFTGGGSLVRGLSDEISARMERRLLRIPPAGGRYDLVRLGTALGGASVILDYARTQLHQEPRRRPTIAEVTPYYQDCSCGGNPACPRCCGSGIIK